jgi:hypothetical protein
MEKEIKRIWLMVHPGCEKRFTPQDMENYKRIIDMVARDPKAGFVVAPAYGGKGTPIENELRGYARRAIPADRIAEVQSTGRLARNPFEKRIAPKTSLFAIGSYLAASVMECAASASDELGIPRKNVVILPRYCVHYPLFDLKKPAEMGLILRSGEAERAKFRNLRRSFGFHMGPVPSIEGKLRRMRGKK